ncbi:MAG TPA: hypothetical protein VEK38_04490 [Candidatus Bathyarchaeia archaeon]|nr:hypothetical protein [Candidatus Bathyarchaeia archaeon]
MKTFKTVITIMVVLCTVSTQISASYKVSQATIDRARKRAAALKKGSGAQSTQTKKPTTNTPKKPITNISSQNSLPKDLQGKRITHVKANPQQGATCGYHTFINAKAVEELLAEGKALTSANIITKNKQKLELFGITSNFPLMHTNQMCEWKEQILNIGNIYTLSQAQKKLGLIAIGDIVEFKDAIETLKATTTPMVVNIACHTGSEKSGHWSYVGLVKEKNKEIRLIYLNSTSATLAQDSAIVELIKYIYTFIE